ncbi:hypothetical protein G4B88_015277 [Cannabis sativa]|uniref:Uncharacterized protein n=1 Tax=Cannabis sativa TaxID=3483 RepID=A0A7J6E4H2_CANSA|nr:hypothetical protein G4B88_015277 [Cannabis sativa]
MLSISGLRHPESKHNDMLYLRVRQLTWRNWREGNVSNIVDPLMRGGSRYEIMRCIHIGLLCVQENMTDRPTMNAIVLIRSMAKTTQTLSATPTRTSLLRQLTQQQFGHGNFQSNHGAGQLGNQFGNRSFNRGNDYGFTPGLNSGGRGNFYPNRGGRLSSMNKHQQWWISAITATTC